MPEIRTHVKYSVVGVNGLSPSEIKRKLESLASDCDNLPTLDQKSYKPTKAYSVVQVLNLLKQFQDSVVNSGRTDLSLLELKHFIENSITKPWTFYELEKK